MKNILLPIDFSDVQDHVLAFVDGFAKPLGSKIWLVHVAAPDPDFVGFKVGPEYVREQRADFLREEHQRIQSMAQTKRAEGWECEALLVQGPTTETILELVQKLQIDMIVMGSHGHGALFKAFVGSVSEQVLRDSKVPVLIIPSQRPS